MRIIKRACVLLLMVIFMIAPDLSSIRGIPAVAEAAGSVKLSDSDITMYIGEAYFLSVINSKEKIVWSSNKPWVVDVSKSGKITAYKEGTAKITAKVGKKSYTCNVKVNGNTTIYGKVSEIEDKMITIALGTLHENGIQTSDGELEYLTLSGKKAILEVKDTSILYREEVSSDAKEGNGNAGSPAALFDISTGDLLKVTYSSSIKEPVSIIILNPRKDAEGEKPSDETAVVTGTAAYNLTTGEALTSSTYDSTKADENAIRGDGPIFASLSNASVNKSGGAASNRMSSSNYGLNAAILAMNEARLRINGGTINSTAEDANGVFAYNKSMIDIANATIDAIGVNAGGLVVAADGFINATNLRVNTKEKAALCSGLGGGKIIAYGGSYTSSGSPGVPVIYSTANISVNSAIINATDSEAVIVDEEGSVSINNCSVTGNMKGTYNSSNGVNIHNIMLYQKSAETKKGTTSFSMSGGTLTSKNGDMFYVTNTDGVIKLSNVGMNLADNSKLLVVAGNDASSGWGKEGSNGGNCTFSNTNQYLKGDITVDAVSTLDIKLEEGSFYRGSINADQKDAKNISVTIDSTSRWTLTQDSYITDFNGKLYDINYNGYTLYINGVAKN